MMVVTEGMVVVMVGSRDNAATKEAAGGRRDYGDRGGNGGRGGNNQGE